MAAVLGIDGSLNIPLEEVDVAASSRNATSMELPFRELLVRNWSRVKHLPHGWAIPQNRERVGTLEAVELTPHEIEDCLKALNGCVAARIVECLFLEIVERVIKEREKLHCCLKELGFDLCDALRK